MKNVVVGAGISGLATAWRLRNEEVHVIEASPRVGGWIGRIEAPFPFSLGPRTIRCREGGALLTLVREMGLEPLPEVKGLQRYVYWRGALHPLSHLLKGIKRDLIWGLLKPIPKEDQSVASFFRSHFSNEVANRLGIPFLRGVFGQDGEALSLKAAFPWMGRGPLLRHFFRKKGTFLTLSGGLMTLIERLQDRLSDKISLNEKVVGIEKGCVTTTKRKISCDRVISTVPSPELPHSSITSVHFYWKKKKEKVKGFGYLVSPEEKGNVLGALFDSEISQAQGTAITVMLSGIVEGLEEGKEALKKHLGIFEEADFAKVTYAKDAIPSYPVGHKMLNENNGWLIRLGTSFSGISVADVVEGAFAWKL